MSTWKNPQFEKLALEAVWDLGADLIKVNPKDVNLWEENFRTYGPSKRVEFYANLLGALSHFESGQKPDVTYKENFKDRKGKNVISRGLLQLSIESVNGYGFGLLDELKLHDPETNLRAGVYIMRKWVVKDGVISGKGLLNVGWRGMARYFSPFRDKSKLAVMRAKTKG